MLVSSLIKKQNTNAKQCKSEKNKPLLIQGDAAAVRAHAGKLDSRSIFLSFVGDWYQRSSSRAVHAQRRGEEQRAVSSARGSFALPGGG